jgi:hypothetical protein
MRCIVSLILALFSFTSAVCADPTPPSPVLGCPIPSFKDIVLIGVGDSLTHGTMDATDNATNTQHAYLQKVYESLAQVAEVSFSQPLFDYEENRMLPFTIPTNLGVEGSDIYSLEGIEYYKRYGVDESFLTGKYLGDSLFPWWLHDLYDKVLYPINLLALKPVSQLDATVWLLNQVAEAGQSKSVVIFWMGNSDSSNAALGLGTNNPIYIPLPLDQLEQELNPLLFTLLRFWEQSGLISFEPYTISSIERNLTNADDFAEQYHRVLTRLATEVPSLATHAELFLCTLPYYSSVGYLLDSEDMEYYLQKVNLTYTVPPSFKRVTEPGTPITDFSKGDRVSLFTFLTMYILLDQGNSVAQVNQILERDGAQRDGMVLSEDEQYHIRERIDSFNEAVKESVLTSTTHVHLIDSATYLNDALTGKISITINDKTLNRKWGRGNSFTLDGVHPGYTAHTLIANFIIEHLNDTLTMNAPLHELSEVMETDPYVDKDGDGWVEGPAYTASGITELLFLFKDPDDSDPTLQPTLPPDIWNYVTNILLREFLF